MECRWVEERIVALQDDELSRSERAMLEEHLEGCPACAELEEDLAAISPAPCLSVPPEVAARLAAAIDQAIDEALAAPLPLEPVGRVERSRRWLRRDRDLSNGAMLAYAAALAICLGWGLSNWIALPTSQASTTTIARTDVKSTVRADHYRPASYAIEADEDDENDDWR